MLPPATPAPTPTGAASFGTTALPAAPGGEAMRVDWNASLPRGLSKAFFDLPLDHFQQQQGRGSIASPVYGAAPAWPYGAQAYISSAPPTAQYTTARGGHRRRRLSSATDSNVSSSYGSSTDGHPNSLVIRFKKLGAHSFEASNQTTDADDDTASQSSEKSSSDGATSSDEKSPRQPSSTSKAANKAASKAGGGSKASSKPAATGAEKIKETGVLAIPDDGQPRIGIYTLPERRDRVARFHAKRKRRVWSKRINYTCRKKLADSRPRVGGRFVKRVATTTQ